MQRQRLNYKMFMPVIALIALLLTAFSWTAHKVSVAPQTDRGFQILKYNNPGAVSDLGVGLWAWPLPMDFDKDGDMDMLVNCSDKPFNGIWFFENTSGEKFPVLEAPIRLGDGHRNIQISYTDAGPRVLIPGAELDLSAESFGKEKLRILTEDFVTSDMRKKPRFNLWKMVDYEGDGDHDIIIGVDDWSDYGWDNAYDENGNWTNGPLHGYVYLVENDRGEYKNKGRLTAGGKVIDVYGAPSPNLADFDNDGDLDLICGEFLDRFTWFENIGTREKPRYRKGEYLRNSDGLIKMDLQMITPMAVDWNNDGFVDLVVGDEDGRVAYLENTGKQYDRMPLFRSPVYFRQKADNVKFGALATPVGVDWDEDGDDDIITGNTAGRIAFIENTGMRNGMPVWKAPTLLEAGEEQIRIQAGDNGSIQGPAEAKWGYTTLSVADWDGDGRHDLVVNSIWGKVIWYKNEGKPGKPKLLKAAPIKVDWGGKDVPKPSGTWWTPERNTLATQWRTTPLAYDWNKDGLMDLIMLDHEGYLTYFERFRNGKELWLKPGKRIFYGEDYSVYSRNQVIEDSVPGVLRLNNREFGGSGRRKISIADWNVDGKPDILINSINASLMENVGTREGITYFRYHPPLSDKALAGHSTSPTAVDWNTDGVPDLLVGAEDGHFYYLQNPNSASGK